MFIIWIQTSKHYTKPISLHRNQIFLELYSFLAINAIKHWYYCSKMLFKLLNLSVMSIQSPKQSGIIKEALDLESHIPGFQSWLGHC